MMHDAECVVLLRAQTILDANVHSAIPFFFSLYAVAPPDGTYDLAGMLALGKVAYTGAFFATCSFAMQHTRV